LVVSYYTYKLILLVDTGQEHINPPRKFGNQAGIITFDREFGK
jgi:hypothetical protein